MLSIEAELLSTEYRTNQVVHSDAKRTALCAWAIIRSPLISITP